MRRISLGIRNVLISFCLLHAGLGHSAAPVPDQSWELLNTEDGVTVYRSTQPQDHIFTFRGIGLVPAGIPKLLAMMSDPSHMPQWVYNCIEGKLVERNFKETDRGADPSHYYQIFYGVTSVPWPLQPRDYVLKAQISYERLPDAALPKSVTVSMRSIQHPDKPPVKGRVRMPMMESMIVMSPDEQNPENTWVDFSVTSNPGGVIPSWIAKMASRDIPRKTLLSLRKLAKEQDYNKDIEALVLYHYKQPTRKGG